MVSRSHKAAFFLDFLEFVILQKCSEKKANKIYHIYKAIVVLHIYNRILGIPLPGYPGNKNHIVMLIKVLVVHVFYTKSQ